MKGDALSGSLHQGHCNSVNEEAKGVDSLLVNCSKRSQTPVVGMAGTDIAAKR